MEEYEKDRPRKKILPKQEQRTILKKAEKFILKDLLPNMKINKILLFGSVAKGTFGRYEKKWKHGLYSDIDALILAENDYRIPKTWKHWYRNKNFTVYTHGRMDRMYLVQYMVWKRKKYENKKNQVDAEKWGIPLMLKKSKNKYRLIYEKRE